MCASVDIFMKRKRHLLPLQRLKVKCSASEELIDSKREMKLLGHRTVSQTCKSKMYNMIIYYHYKIRPHICHKYPIEM